MVLCLVGSPRLHPSSCGVAAFLSESINRVIIVGRKLKHGLGPMVPEAMRSPDIHEGSTIARRTISEQTEETHPGITYPAGSSRILGYKVLSEP